MKETIVLIVSSIGLIVLGYGVRLLQEAARELFRTKSYRDDYIDWSKIPGKFGFAMVQDDGVLIVGRDFMDGDKPSPSDDGAWSWIWTLDLDDYQEAIIGPLPPWRESLRKRPGSEK